MTEPTLKELLENQIKHLKELSDSQVKWLDRYFSDQVLTIQDRTREAKEQIDKRLEGMNEFRDALKDSEAARQREFAQFVTAATLNELKETVDRRLKMLELREARLTGMATIVAAIVSVAVSFAIAALMRII